MVNWSLKAKNSVTYLKEGSLFAAETGLKMCPMTLVPYIGYKLARYGKGGLVKGLDPVFQVTDTVADIAEGKIDNFHTEPLGEQTCAYAAMVSELGGYTECADFYEPFMPRTEAKTLCRSIMTGTITPADSALLKRIEKGSVAHIRTTLKDIVEDRVPDWKAPSLPDLPDWKVPSLPDWKAPSFGIGKYIFLLILLIVGLIALGYSGMGGILQSEHTKHRKKD